MSNLPLLSVSFSGCGFLGLFHVGSISAWRENKNKVKIDKAMGASAGAIAAMALVADVPVQLLRER